MGGSGVVCSGKSSERWRGFALSRKKAGRPLAAYPFR